jgi:hypothetical protein
MTYQHPNFILVALPSVLSTAAISRPLSVYATVALGLVAFAMRPNSRLILTWECAILPVAAIAIVARPNYPTTGFSVVFFCLGCIVLARAIYVSTSRASAITSLIDGVGLFLAVSVGLFELGIRGTQERTAGLENSLTGGVRAFFPLSGSLGATPAMAAVYLAAVMPILITQRGGRWARLLCVGAALSIFILSDTRASLLGALFLAAWVLLAPRMFRRLAPWLVGTSMAVALIYTYIQAAVGYLMVAASDYVPWLVRQGEKPATLNGRDFIWSNSVSYYVSQIDWIRQMIGFGAYGHAASGASSTYNSGFRGFGDRRLITPHNSTIQLLFDGGWLITGTVVTTLIITALLLARRTTPVDLAALATLVALAVVGITEVGLSPGHAQPTWWILLALNVITFTSGRQVETNSRLSDQDRPDRIRTPSPSKARG